MSDTENENISVDENTTEQNPSTETDAGPEQTDSSNNLNFVNPNVTMSKSPFKDELLKKQSEAEALYGFGLSIENIEKIETPNVKLLRDTDVKWQTAYGQSFTQVSPVFLEEQPALQPERAMLTGKWSQYLNLQGYKLQVDSPRIEPSTNGEKLTGTAAISKLNMLLGGGKYIRIPLFASGFWITLSVPSNSELLNLNLTLEDKKGQVGRATAGAIFSNRQALMIEDIFTFIREHIYSTSIKNWIDVDLAKYIKTVDLYPLLQAMSTCMFPDGFKHKIPCVSNPLKCNYVKEVTLNLAKMYWTDETKLTVGQTKFMYDSINNPRTIKEITQYQTDLALNTDNQVHINDNVTAVLRIGTISDLIESGNRWIADVSNIVDKLAFSKADNEQRQYLLHSHMAVSSIREYAHYVERIVLTANDEDQYIDEPGTIESSITAIAADSDLADVFVKGVSNFIERNIVTVIGTPNFECPECQKSQTSESSIHPLIVAFDPLVVFTTLLDRRLSLIGN